MEIFPCLGLGLSKKSASFAFFVCVCELNRLALLKSTTVSGTHTHFKNTFLNLMSVFIVLMGISLSDIVLSVTSGEDASSLAVLQNVCVHSHIKICFSWVGFRVSMEMRRVTPCFLIAYFSESDPHNSVAFPLLLAKLGI